MSRFLNSFYESLAPYTPGEQLNDKKYIKLNTNESPFPPSPRVKSVLNGDLADGLNLYPDPALNKLISAIAQANHVTPDRVFAGNGSDDVLAFAIMAFAGRGGKMCCPDITYGFYPVYAQLFGVSLTQVPLKDDFTIDIGDYTGRGENIVLANPNAPTGLALSADDIEKIVASNPDNIVIIDEAYVDFCGCSCVKLLDRYDNLIVVKTFSKGLFLAGLRVGYALASKEIIQDFNKIKFSFNPYNLNTLTINAASNAILDKAYYKSCIEKIVSVREWTKEKLEKMDSMCRILKLILFLHRIIK